MIGLHRVMPSFQDYKFDLTAFEYAPEPIDPYLTVSARVGFRVTDALSGQQLNEAHI
jgi:hypothetical protein